MGCLNNWTTNTNKAKSIDGNWQPSGLTKTTMKQRSNFQRNSFIHLSGKAVIYCF